MAINRTIYTAGFANIIWTKDPQGYIWNGKTAGTAAIGSASLVLQSLDFSRDIPKETITAFGTSQFVRVSNEAESSEIEMELYPVPGIGTACNALAAAALAEKPSYVNVYSTAGNLRNALMGSLEFEASVGDVPSMSMTFQGTFGAAGNGGYAGTRAYEASINPTTTMAALANVGTTATVNIGVWGVPSLKIANGEAAALQYVFPQSASFSWDSGVESVTRLGEAINTATYFGNPPGEASIECEGLRSPGAVEWLYIFTTNTAYSTETFTGSISSSGGISGGQTLAIGAKFIDQKGDISSQSTSVAVGDLFGTWSTTTEGTAQGVTIG
jgi:hypothetical protein